MTLQYYKTPSNLSSPVEAYLINLKTLLCRNKLETVPLPVVFHYNTREQRAQRRTNKTSYGYPYTIHDSSLLLLIISHSVNFGSAPLLDQTAVAAGSPPGNSHPQ